MMANLDFKATRSLQEALDFLDTNSEVKVIAGGTDVMVNLYKENYSYSGILLDISRIEELKEIRQEEGWIKIGPLVTHTMLLKNELLEDKFPVLTAAARTIGSTQVRNRGTIGGNINNASPAADLIPPLIALKAEVKLQSSSSERLMPLVDFIIGPYRTAIRESELITEIKIPLIKEKYYSNFQKIGRRKTLAIARINIAIVAIIDEHKVIRDIKIVPGSATPSPRAFNKLEEAVTGQEITGLNLEELGKLAGEEMVALTGERWSTPYKKPALSALVKRSLTAVIKEVEGDGENQN